jgi:hypothetical protein
MVATGDVSIDVGGKQGRLTVDSGELLHAETTDCQDRGDGNGIALYVSIISHLHISEILTAREK